MELRREHRSDKSDRPRLQGDAPRASIAPGKSNRAHAAYAGVPAPAGSQPLDWGAQLDASRYASAASAEGPGYALSRIEGDIAQAEELLGQVQSIAVPAFHLAVAALDAPAARQLAQAIVGGVAAAIRQVKDAPTRLALADPHAQLVSRPGEITERPPPSPEEVAELERVSNALAVHQGLSNGMIEWIRRECSVCTFGGDTVPGLQGHIPPLNGDPVSALVNETAIVVDVLTVATAICEIVSDPNLAGPEGIEHARDMVRAWRSRPATYVFLRHILMQRGWWGMLVQGSELETISEDVKKQSEHTGVFGDVGEWDQRAVLSLLTRDRHDWTVSDDDAQEVVKQIQSATPATRADLIMQLESMGKLDTLCENLPWRVVEQMWHAIEDPDARRLLGPHWATKGGRESASQFYDRNIREAVDGQRYEEAWHLVLLDKAHSMATFGFKDMHDRAYEASEDGWISDDAYYSTSGKAMARSAVLMAATGVSGGAAGAWGEGAALGMGAGATTAQVIGGAVGGAASGIAGQFTGDVFDMAFMGADGFSPAGDYAAAGYTGAISGAVTARLGAQGAKWLPQSAKTMSQLYAERFPGLDNVLTRIRNHGARSGFVVKATRAELLEMAEAELISMADLRVRLENVREIASNSRIPIEDVVLAKAQPASEVEKTIGPIDPATGDVTVLNENPTTAGYVFVAEDMPPGARATDHGVREALGIDGEPGWPRYERYKDPNDQMYEVRFKVSTELDVPLPQDNAAETGYTRLGGIDPRSSHRPGVGRTKGGAREGIAPRGTPIEIIEIVPVGHPRGLRAAGRPYAPYPAAPPSVRNLYAPLDGAAHGGIASEVDEDDLDLEVD